MAVTVEELESRLGKVEYWRNGNGTKGAALVIEDHEKRIDCIEKHHLQESDILKKVVKDAMSERAKSKEGWVRAMGPYFGALCSIIVAILFIVFGG